MKKVIIVLIVCIIAIVLVYMARTGTSLFAVKQDFVYSNDFKVNKLQIKNADFHFNKLTAEQKLIYSAIAKAVNKLQTNFLISEYNVGSDADAISVDANRAITAFFNDHPEVFYLLSSYKVITRNKLFNDTLELQLQYTYSSLDELEKGIDKVDNVIKEYTNTLGNMTDFNKELYLHDKVAKEIKTYVDPSNNYLNIPEEYHNAYTALINKKAVCDGYTKALQLLLDRVNIENTFVTGTVGKVPHAWMVVKIDNKWYNLDLTTNKYMSEEENVNNVVAHTYFNVTNEYLLKTHKIDNEYSEIVANSKDNNYFVKLDKYISSNEDFNTKLKQIVQNQEQEYCLEFATDHTNVPNRMLNLLYDINFDSYKSSKATVTMKYYNQIDTYLVLKKSK